MKFTLELEQDEVYTVLHSVFCDGLYGLSRAGIILDYNEENYQVARANLFYPCMEDVWLQILKDGNSLIFKDGEDNDKVIAELTLTKAIEGLKNPAIANDIMDIVNEDYDANTGDRVIQYLLFGKLVFG